MSNGYVHNKQLELQKRRVKLSNGQHKSIWIKRTKLSAEQIRAERKDILAYIKELDAKCK